MFIINPYRFGSSTPPFVGLLDLYPGALGAYSLRLLSSSFIGPTNFPIRIRRTVSGNSTEVDVAFDLLNTISLNSPIYNITTPTPLFPTLATTLGEFVNAPGFSNPDSLVGTQSAFVSIFYDQSGNNYNLIQTAPVNQPRIVLNGVVDTYNSKPSILFSFSNAPTDVKFFNNAVVPTISSYGNSFFVVAAPTTSTTSNIFGLGDTALSTRYINLQNTLGNQRLVTVLGGTTVDASVLAPINEQYTYYGRTLNTGFIEAAITNTTLLTPNLPVLSSTSVGSFNVNAIIMSKRTASGSLATFTGYISEAIVYNSNQSSNRVNIQQDQITYY
jgi:hypothetical protein